MSRHAIIEAGSATVAAFGAEVSYRYAIMYFKQDGTHLGSISIEPDFQAAKDCTYFAGMRDGRLPAVTAAAHGSVSPVWSEERGAPYCRGVRVDTTEVDGNGETVSCEFPKSYFKSHAEKGSLEWVEKGELQPDERYGYFLCAYPIAGEAAATNTNRDETAASGAFQIEAVLDRIPLEESQLDSFRDRATARDEQTEGDVPVFFAQTVIDEACALATEAGKSETGGVLVGRLHHDAAKPELFIEVVAQIPAKYAEATGTSFEFTPETWAAADAAIELRGRNELIIGWWHSHPRFCNPECPEERRKACPLATSFFSAEDVHLHHVCFPQPYQVALLISELPDTGSTPAVFGWRAGTVSTRGYYAVS